MASCERTRVAVWYLAFALASSGAGSAHAAELCVRPAACRRRISGEPWRRLFRRGALLGAAPAHGRCIALALRLAWAFFRRPPLYRRFWPKARRLAGRKTLFSDAAPMPSLDPRHAACLSSAGRLLDVSAAALTGPDAFFTAGSYIY